MLLSLGIPFALIPLVRLTGDHRVMGAFTNRAVLRIKATIATALVIVSNLVLLLLLIAGDI